MQDAVLFQSVFVVMQTLQHQHSSTPWQQLQSSYSMFSIH